MNVYIKAEESVRVSRAEVKLEDVLSLYCPDYETGESLKKTQAFSFPDTGKSEKDFFPILKVVQKIQEMDSRLEVVNMGPEDFVVTYERQKKGKSWTTVGKIVFVCLTAFLRGGFFHYVL